MVTWPFGCEPIKRRYRQKSRLVRWYKLLYKPMAKSMERGKFRQPRVPKPFNRVHEIQTLELSPGYHPPCKISVRYDDVDGLRKCSDFDCTSGFFLYGRPMEYGRPLYFHVVVSFYLLLLFSFFPCLISAAAHCMYTIFAHMVWR